MTDFTAPDLSDFIIGFRQWKLDGSWLTPLYRGPLWSPGVNLAHCDCEFPDKDRDQKRRGARMHTITFNIISFSGRAEPYETPKFPPLVHKPPHELCHCGFHAYHTTEGLPKNTEPVVSGAMAAWGDVITFESGFRAQYAMPVVVHLPKELVYAASGLEQLYGIELAPSVDSLEAIASHYGSVMPFQIRPAGEEKKKPPAYVTGGPVSSPPTTTDKRRFALRVFGF